MLHIEEAFKSHSIGFGGGSISGEGKGYGFGPISEKESIHLLREAKDKGIKIFDTAPIYGFGTSELRMGKAFHKIREEVFICSKGGITWDQSKRVDLDNSVMEKMLDDSLLNLDTDYIDLYMIHWPDPRCDIRKSMEVLSRAKEKGKINHIGLCNTNHDEYQKALEVDCIEVLQSEFNIFNTEVQANLLDHIKEDIYFMGWGTLDKGIISGTVKPERKFDSSDARSWAPWWKKSNKDQKMKIMEGIINYLRENGYNGIQLALGHNLLFPDVSLSLVGCRNIEQLDSLLKAINNLPPKIIIENALEML